MTREKWAKLDQRKKRIKISHLLGWTDCIDYTDKGGNPHGCDPDTLEGAMIPDYLNDLNAMHEVEKGITDAETRFKYQIKIHELLFDYTGQCSVWCICHATAAQRAEAFVMTIKDEEDA